MFEWWKTPTEKLPLTLHDDFAFQSGFAELTAAEWLWWVRQNPGWSRILLLTTFDAEEGGAVVWRAVDPVTLLYHQISWVFRWDRAGIRRLVETVANIPEGA